MGLLGNLFPEEFINRQIENSLVPGGVFYLSCGFTNPPKEKYVVLVHLDDEPLIFVVNSKIHQFIVSRPDLNRCQVKLNADDYPFLSHDSYLDCSNPITEMTRNEIVGQVRSDLDRIIGVLNDITLAEVIEVVNSARTISQDQKRRIISYLGS